MFAQFPLIKRGFSVAAVVLVFSVSQLINFVTELFISKSINNYDCPVFYFLYKNQSFNVYRRQSVILSKQ